MFEGYVQKILQDLVGKYIEGLDKSNLKIGLLSGNVELKNLKLKKDLFALLKLPFVIKHSKIKLLKLTIPSYMSMFSEPLELTLESVLIVLTPLPKTEWQPIHSWSLETKMELIQEFIQSMAEKLLEQQKLYKSGNNLKKESAAEEGYWYRKIIKAIDNIQITIKNIHIRYEDGVTVKDKPFSLGFTLKDLSAKTTNENWEDKFFDRMKKENRSKPVHKYLQINGFAVYVNTFDQSNHSTLETNETPENYSLRMEQFLFDMFPKDQLKIQKADYFVEPIDVNARFTYLTRVERDKPMYSLEIKFHERSITLAKDQYEVMIKLADFVKAYTVFLENSQAIKKYKFLRPIFPIIHYSTHTVPITQRQIKPTEENLLEKKQSKQQNPSIVQQVDGLDDTDEFESAFSQYQLDESMRFTSLYNNQEFEGREDAKSEVTKSVLNRSYHSFASVPDSDYQKESSLRLYQRNQMFNNYNAVDWWQFAIKSVVKDNRSKNGYWSEFKIDTARKRQYALHLVKLIYRYLNKNFEVDYSLMQEDERLLFQHIIEANEMTDIRSWVGISMNRKHQKLLELIVKKKNKKKDDNQQIAMPSPNPLKEERKVSQSSNFFNFGSRMPKLSINPRASEMSRPEGLNDDSASSQTLNTITYTEFQELANDPDEADQITLTKQELDTVIDWLSNFLKDDDSTAQDQQSLSSSADGLTLEERQQLIKFSLHVSQGSGQITLTDKDKYSIRMYQKELVIEYKHKRDNTFEAEITNKSVGVEIETFCQRGNNEIFKDFKDSFKKQIIQPLDEIKKSKSNFLEVHISKVMDLGIGSFIDINIQSKPLKIYYDAIAFSKLQQFFKIEDVSEEIRAQAYDKYQALKDKTETSIKELFQEQSYRLKLHIASPILEIPFHSTLIDLPMHEKEAQNYDRMWLMNLGNITFRTPEPHEKVKQQALKMSESGSGVTEQLPFDMYERFKINIEKVTVQYHWLGGDVRSVKVLKEVQLQLDIGIQNQTRAALLIGDHSINCENHFRPPALQIEGKIPMLSLNMTPDVYNAVINLSKILSQSNANENLKLLRSEKNSLIEDSYFIKDVKVKGIKNRNAIFEPFNLMASGSYIYFYRSKSDLVPQHFISIMESKLITVETQAISKQATNLQIKSRFGSELNICFDNYSDYNDFLRKVTFRQTMGDFNEFIFESNIDSSSSQTAQNNNIEMLRQDPRDAKLGLSIEIGNIEVRLHKSEDALLLEEFDFEKKQWMILDIKKITLSLNSFTYDSKMQVRLAQLCFKETESLNTDILRNDIGENLCEIDINNYDVFSPNMEDTESDINIRLGKLFFLFDPYTINNLIKFLRYTRYQEDEQQLAELYNTLRSNDEILPETKQLNQNKQNMKFEEVKSVVAQTCQTVKHMLLKTKIQAKGIGILAVHHLYPKVPIFELNVGDNSISYNMYFDHDVLSMDLTNVQLFDLTRYPKTINPIKYPETVGDPVAILDNINQLHLRGQEILGISKSQNFYDLNNGIKLTCSMYRPGCPFQKPEKQTVVDLDISQVKILYLQEQMFRLIDYFLDKFLWAITDADPYQKKKIMFMDHFSQKKILTDFEFIKAEEVEKFDLKQLRSTSDVRIKVHRPTVIIKDRPYFERFLEVDLGEISINLFDQLEEKRFYRFPNKAVVTSTMIIECKDLGIRLQPDNFVMADPFDLKLAITNIGFSSEIEKVDTKEFDKSSRICVEINPKFSIHLTQDLYTFILRCSDLNISYTDQLQPLYNFRLNQDYFRSTEFLPQISISVNMPYLVMSIYKDVTLMKLVASDNCSEVQGKLCEVAIRRPKIGIQLYLNSEIKISAEIQAISSYFYDDSQVEKRLLFGSCTQRHSLPSEEDILEIMKELPPIKRQLQNLSFEIPQLLLLLDMYPDGKKNINIVINSLKLILQPYYFLMLQHFMIEGMPSYDEQDFDKPNQFSSDIEDCSVLTCKIIMDQIMICFKGDHNGKEEMSQMSKNDEREEQVIACLTQIEYTFQREKIKTSKNKVIKSAMKELEKQKKSKKIQEPYFWMQLQLKDFNPFICKYGDLETIDISMIKKRQIVEPFSMKYHDAKFIFWNPLKSLRDLFNRSKQEVILNKLLFKLSFTDYVLLGEIYSYFNASFERFNTFHLRYKKEKFRAQKFLGQFELDQLVDKASIFTSTQTALQMMRGYTRVLPQQQQQMPADLNRSKRRDATRMTNQKIIRHIDFKEDLELYRIQEEDDFESEEQNEAPINPQFDLDKYENKDFVVNCDGIYAVVINDLKGIFYPVMSFAITKFKFKSMEESLVIHSHTHLKLIASYYNLYDQLWEPLIEKLRLEYKQQSESELSVLIHKDLNLNITTEFLSNILQTLNSLGNHNNFMAELTHDDIKQRLRESYSQSIFQSQKSNHMKQKQQVTQGLQITLEQKLTLFSFVNMTSKNLSIQKSMQRSKQLRTKYRAKPGESVDFEVDFQEEAENIGQWQIEELGRQRKCELYTVKIHEGKQQIKGISLRDGNSYHHQINEKEFVAYGIKTENLKKSLIIRAQFIINNNTFQIYRLKFLKLAAIIGGQLSEVKIVDLLPGSSYPIDYIDQKYMVAFSPLVNNQNNNLWSRPLSMKTLIKKLNLNTTTFLEHTAAQFTIITKDQGPFANTFDINLKTPLILMNCLPCSLTVHPIQTHIDEQTRPTTILKGTQQEFQCFNLKDLITLRFSLNDNLSTPLSVSHSDLINHTLIERFVTFPDLQQLVLHLKLDKHCQSAGLRMSIYAKNVIVNNTGDKQGGFISMQECDRRGKESVTREICEDVILANQSEKIVLSRMSNDGKVKYMSKAFKVNEPGLSHQIYLKTRDNCFQDLRILTTKSRSRVETDYGLVTTISPSYILVNQTNLTLEVCQTDFHIRGISQIIESEMREPLVWAETSVENRRAEKAIRFRCLDGTNQGTYEWSSMIKVKNVGQETYLMWHSKKQQFNKNFLVEIYIQPETQICFIIFTEQSLISIAKEENLSLQERKDSLSLSLNNLSQVKKAHPTFIIDNQSNDVQVLVYQKGFYNHQLKLLPQTDQIFSWSDPSTNPTDKVIILRLQKDGKDLTTEPLELLPGDLDYQRQILVPITQPASLNRMTLLSTRMTALHQQQQQQQEVQETRCLQVFNQTDGQSLITRVTYMTKKESERMLVNQKKPQEKKAQKVEISINEINMSLICKDSIGQRKEICMLNLSGLEFVKIVEQDISTMQLKIGYIQLDNNIGDNALFPVVLYPKDIYSKKDMKNHKKQSICDIQQDFLNLHLSLRTDLPAAVTYIERLQFLISPLVIKLDDDFLVHLIRFQKAIETDNNYITTVYKASSIHPLFLPQQQQQQPTNASSNNFQIEGNRVSAAVSMYEITEQNKESEEESQIVFVEEYKKKEQRGSHQQQDEFNQGIQDRSIEETEDQEEEEVEMIINEDYVSSKSSMKSKTVSEFNLQPNWENFKLQNDKSKIYIKELISSPLSIKLTLITRAKLNIKGDTSLHRFGFQEQLLQYLANLVNLEGAQIDINALQLINIFGDQAQISSQLSNHYAQNLKHILLKLLGQTNMLGDPVNFVQHLGIGMKDFIYKPYDGLTRGPLAAGKGFVQGTASLIKHPIEGTFGSVSKICNSWSKGMLFFIENQEYINKREEEIREKAKNPIEGLGFGLKYTLTGISQGLSGVVEKPYEGAQEDGVKGFLKGAMKGVGGLVIMPVSGTLDFISKTSEGIKNLVTTRDREVSKLRILRPFYGSNQTIKIYDDFHAYIFQHLIRLNREKYSQDHFLDALYYDNSEQKNVIVLTEEHLLIVNATIKQVAFEAKSQSLIKLMREGSAQDIISLFIKTEPYITPAVPQGLQRGILKNNLGQSYQVDVLKICIDDPDKREQYYRKLSNYIHLIHELHRAGADNNTTI